MTTYLIKLPILEQISKHDIIILIGPQLEWKMNKFGLFGPIRSELDKQTNKHANKQTNEQKTKEK